MIRRSQQSSGRRRAYLAIATSLLLGGLLWFTFSPAIKAAAQHVFGDSGQLAASDIQALKESPLGRQLVARGLTPLYKHQKNGNAMWSVPCGSIDADDCLQAMVAGGNRTIFTSYTRDWRGEIYGARLDQVGWIAGQTGQPGVVVLTPLSFCTVLPGVTVEDLFTYTLPNARYCK